MCITCKIEPKQYSVFVLLGSSFLHFKYLHLDLYNHFSQHISCHGWVKTPELNIELTQAMYSFFFLKLVLSTGRLIWNTLNNAQLVKITQEVLYLLLIYEFLVCSGWEQQICFPFFLLVFSHLCRFHLIKFSIDS